MGVYVSDHGIKVRMVHCTRVVPWSRVTRVWAGQAAHYDAWQMWISVRDPERGRRYADLAPRLPDTPPVAFDPMDPTDRSGADPDRLLRDMTEPGLDMSGAGLDPADPDYVDVPSTEAAFALTQRITGVPFTADLLHSATYRIGAVPDRLWPAA